MAQYSTGRALHSTAQRSRVERGTPLLTQSDSKLPRVETLQSGEDDNYHHRPRFHRHLILGLIPA